MGDRIDWAELRGQWRPRWLSCIQQFADLDTQHRKWLDPVNTNPHWSFIEYMCCYFDDIGLSDPDLGYSGWVVRGLVTQKEVEAVRDFHALADAYASPSGDDYDNAAILEDQGWHAVVDAARKAQRALSVVIDDPDELRLLLEP